MPAWLLGSLAGKILVGTVAATAGTGGLAAAGVLPDPLQQRVTDLAENVGVSVPSPEDNAARNGEEIDEDVRDGEPTDAVNHGNCVSYATREADSLGLTGRQRGTFISRVAQDESATSAEVPEGGSPGPACEAAVAAAWAELTTGGPAPSPNAPGGRPDDVGRPEAPGPGSEAPPRPGRREEPNRPPAPTTQNPTGSGQGGQPTGTPSTSVPPGPPTSADRGSESTSPTRPASRP